LYTNKQFQETQEVGGQYVLAPTQSGRSRMIAAVPSVITALKKLKARQAQMRLAAGSAWENRGRLVFTNEFGGHLAHFTVYKEFKKIVCSIAWIAPVSTMGLLK